MFHTALRSRSLRTFQSRVHGRLICKGDEDYDQARRVWNGRIDKYPAVIVRCADVIDVVTAVEFARSHHLPVAVRGGGHSLCGHSVCDEGLVIDLSGMKGVGIDHERSTARMQAGLTLGEFVQETLRWGLATTTGTSREPVWPG